MDYFNEFYNAVAEARQNYLTNLMKINEPAFIEVRCNVENSDVDASMEEIKPNMDIRRGEPSPCINKLDLETHVHAPREDSDNESNAAFAPTHIDDNLDNVADRNARAASGNGKRIKAAQKTETIADDTLGTNEMVELAKTVYGTYNRTISAAEKKKANNKFQELIPKYFEMCCELCKYKFLTVNQAYTHYRFAHDMSKVKLKCCPELIFSKDIRDHILYHLYPDIFR